MSWKEQWKPKVIASSEDNEGTAEVIRKSLELAKPQIFDFISTEIIEKLIADIPTEWGDDYGGYTSTEKLKQQLKDKWLGEDSLRSVTPEKPECKSAYVKGGKVFNCICGECF